MIHLGDFLRVNAGDPALAILHGGGCAVGSLGAPASRPARGDVACSGTVEDPRRAGLEAGAPGSTLADPRRAWCPTNPTTILQYDYEGTAYTAPAQSLVVSPLPDAPVPRLASPFQSAWDAAVHAAKVEDIRRRIARGDCYQVNLAVPFTARLADGDDLAVFLALLRTSPGPFAGFIRRPGRPTVVSQSPENFLAWDAGRITSSPIKGTRRRILGREDTTRAELLASAKDRAELAMIVDLVRNDLGRLALPGSVQVDAPARLLDLPYVHHLVADISARERPGTTLEDRLTAAFPAGSITGAPKKMAISIIRELEGRPRGAYCGAFGWSNATAGQLAVAIRTAEIHGDRITLWAGSGITADSDGPAEWDEVQAKAAGFAAMFGGGR